jgi:hypothetical protein
MPSGSTAAFSPAQRAVEAVQVHGGSCLGAEAVHPCFLSGNVPCRLLASRFVAIQEYAQRRNSVLAEQQYEEA